MNCPNLISITSLDYWERISSTELEELKIKIRLENIKLEITDNAGGTDELEKKGGLGTTSNLPENPLIEYF